MNLIFTLSCLINKGELINNFSIGFHLDIYRLNPFKLWIMIDTLKLYHLVLVGMTLTFIQGHSCISFSFSFSSRWHRSDQKGPYMLCPISQQSRLPKAAFETVPIFVWLSTDHSRPRRVEYWPLPFSTPLSFRRSMLWCSGLSMFSKFLKPLSTSALPSCRPDVISAVLASLSACSFPLTPACPGQ